MQSKLNCEVLSREVGLQVRWSVVADSAILQVVANLGKMTRSVSRVTCWHKQLLKMII